MFSLSRALSTILIIPAVLLFFANSVFSQAADKKPKGTGTVTGRVTLSDKAVAGVVVIGNLNDAANRQSQVQAVTDGDGLYRLNGLVAGQYTITVVAPTLVLADETNSGFHGYGKTVVMASDETVDNVDIKLIRGGVITGRVTDADNKPVVEQRITLQMADQNGDSNRKPINYIMNFQMSQTDDRGIYRIYGLPAGRYRISVGNDQNAGYVSPNAHTYYPLTFYPDVNDPAKATTVELTEGSEAANIDIHVGHAAITYTATGHVVDAETNQPLAGVRIMYGPWQPNEPSFSVLVGGLPTNSRGEFRVEGLEAGHYGIAVSQSDSSTYSDPVGFDIVDGDITNVEVRAQHGLSLGGVVIVEGNQSKQVLSQIGFLRASVAIESRSNIQNQMESSAGVTPNGTFQINGLRAGRAHLSIHPLTSSILRGISVSRIERAGVDVTRTLEIHSGESISDLQAFVNFGTGIIRGAVKVAGQDDLSKFRIFVTARRDGASTQPSGAIADTRGHFILRNLIPGSYTVSVNINPTGAIPSLVRVIPPEKQTVSVNDDSEVEVLFNVNVIPQ